MSALAPHLILDAVREMSSSERSELAALLLAGVSEAQPGVAPSPPESEMLTVTEAADRAAVHPKTIRRRISAGELPVTRIGSAIRIRRSDLEMFIGPGSVAERESNSATRRRRQPDRGSSVAAAFRDLSIVR